MKYEHYWLIDTAIRCHIPFNWLSARNLAEMLNRETHKLSDAALLETLLHMFAHGDLYLQLSNRDGRDTALMSPSRSFVEATLYANRDQWLTRQQRVFYGVTLQGAAKWERLSTPQWQKFFEAGYEVDPYQGEIIAAERSTAETLLTMTQYDEGIHTVISDSVAWTICQPWQATYWKVLPIAYRVRFTYTPSADTTYAAPVETPAWVQAWRSTQRAWYTSYIGLPCS